MKITKGSLLLILCSISICAYSEMAIFAKKESTTPITRFFIFSERNSGSNYIKSLIKENTYLKINATDYGHKHFLPWLNLPSIIYSGPSQYYNFQDNEDCLFIMIFRNPYNWVRSMHKTPWHADSSLKKISFSDFIRKQWKLKDQVTDAFIQKLMVFNPFLEKDPKDGSYFANVLKLREAKIENMLLLKDRVKNIYYINYETVRDHPIKVLKEISKIFNINLTKKFHPITSKKGENQKPYVPSVYSPLSIEDLTFINEQLDPQLEKNIGYELLERVKDVPRS